MNKPLIGDADIRVEDGCPVDIRVREDGFNQHYNIAILQKGPNQSRSYVTDMVLKVIQPGEVIEPVMTLAKSEIQSLFNELWSLGFRPVDGTGNGGHIQALERHLQDMRKLVFEVPVEITRVAGKE